MKNANPSFASGLSNSLARTRQTPKDVDVGTLMLAWCRTNWLHIAISMIVIASLYDAWLVFHFRSVIDEENAFCRWLISLEPNYVSVFLFGKLLGTLGVATVLYLLSKHWRRVARPTVMVVFTFQVGLMVYLHTYDSVKIKQPQLVAAGNQEMELRIARRHHLIAEATPVQLVQNEVDWDTTSAVGENVSAAAIHKHHRPHFSLARRIVVFERHRAGGRFKPSVKKPVRRPKRTDRMLKDVT